MSFKDILKDSFLQGYINVDMSFKNIVVILTVTGVLGLYLFVVYRVITRKSVYSKSFNIALVALAIITTSVIITIQISMVVSLGMVGALSIVRFRTAIKDPMDLVFLFWAISVGIMCGAGQFLMAGIVCIGLTILITALESIPVVKAPMILVIHSDRSLQESAMEEILTRYSKHYKVKSRSTKNAAKEFVIELRTAKEAELADAFSELEGVNSVSLLAHNGEITY